MSGVRTATVRHVDLAGPMEALAPEGGADGVLAIFWWRGVPLGRRLLTQGELPVPAGAMPALAAAAAAPAIAARGASGPGDLAFGPPPGDASEVSVVVCTRDRGEDLARCLDSLLACDPAPGEIVVVDNDPSGPSTRRVVEDRPSVRYVAEPRPGLSAARNAGVAAATGGIIAFTDDDVTVAPGWLGPLLEGFADPQVGAVTGVVLPARLDSVASATFELTYGGLAGSLLPARYDASFLRPPLTPASDAAPVWRIGAGANMALRRAAIDAAGPFDERLGAGAAGCSEDSEMMYRLLAAGWTCIYDPAAVVFHRHRDTIPALRAQLRAYMRGHIAALLVQFESSRAVGNLIRAFIALPIWFVLVLFGTFWRGDRHRRALLPWEVLGMVEGWTALLRHRRRAPSAERPAADHARLVPGRTQRSHR